MSLGPAIRVEGVTPSAPRFGLLSVAQVLGPDGGGEWENGVALDPSPCGCAEVIDACQAAPTPRDGAPTSPAPPSFDAFTVYLTDVCSTFGFGSPEAFRQRMTTHLEAAQHAAIEREVYTAERLTDNPAIAGPTATVLAAGALDPVAALAELEEGIAARCRAGVIHVTPRVATYFASLNLITTDGAGAASRLRTVALGTPVAVGTGYTGEGPTGTAPAAGQAWAYGTSPLRVRLSDVEVLPDSMAEAVNRSTNTATFRAERSVVVEWDQCIHVAQLVAL